MGLISSRLARENKLGFDKILQGQLSKAMGQTAWGTGSDQSLQLSEKTRSLLRSMPEVKLRFSEDGRRVTIGIRDQEIVIRQVSDDNERNEYAAIRSDFMNLGTVHSLVMCHPAVVFLENNKPTFQYFFEREGLKNLVANFLLDKSTTVMKDGLVYNKSGETTEFSFLSNVVLSYMRDNDHRGLPKLFLGDTMLEETLRYNVFNTSMVETQQLFELAKFFYFFENSRFISEASESGCWKCGQVPSVPQDLTLFLSTSGELKNSYRSDLLSKIIFKAVSASLKGRVYVVASEYLLENLIERILEYTQQRKISGVRFFDFNRTSFIEPYLKDFGAENAQFMMTSSDESVVKEAYFGTIFGIDLQRSFDDQRAQKVYGDIKEEQVKELLQQLDFVDWLGSDSKEDIKAYERLQKSRCEVVKFLQATPSDLVSDLKSPQEIERESEASEGSFRKVTSVIQKLNEREQQKSLEREMMEERPSKSARKSKR